MNIILCIIDTLRYDYIGANGNTWIETPNIDRLSAQSLNFDKVYTSSFPTIPHRTDVMTGRYGSPFHIWMPLRFDSTTLPRLLSDNGYCTQLIHDTPHLVNGGHNFDFPFHAWTMIRGSEVDRPRIDMYGSADDELPGNLRRDPELDELGDDAGWINEMTYIRANRNRSDQSEWNCARLFTGVERFLYDNKGRNNFFLWIDCFDPHEPWDAPPEFMLKYDKTPGYDGRIDPRLWSVRDTSGVSKAISDRIHACYAAKVSWMDHCLGRMLDALDETGLSESTAVVFTADHGTQLNERGYFGKSLPVKEQEGHVPLMIRLPDGPKGRNGSIVQPQDTFATILGIAGSPVPAGLDCRNVLELPRDRGKSSIDPKLATDSSFGKPERTIALSGHAAADWDSVPYPFTVFGDQYYLFAALEPANSQLMRYGETNDISGDHPDIVAKLHAAGVEELERRGADHELINWIRSGGTLPFPAKRPLYDGAPMPLGYEQYFKRVYRH